MGWVVEVGSGGIVLEHPGAVLELVARVQFSVVSGACLPHAEDDVEPALPQTAQGLRVCFASAFEPVVIHFGPGAPCPAQVAEEVHGVAQVPVA